MTEKKYKICSKCKQENLLCDFDKYASQCKKCKKEYNSKYYQENSEKIKERVKEYCQENLEKLKKYKSKYYQKNSEKVKERHAKYRRENPEKEKERKAKYRRENPEKLKKYKSKYERERYKNDENFRIVKLLRNRLWISLKSQSAKKSKRTLELVGCSRDELWDHLEKQFKDEMTRQNLGEWHIDHIKPCSLFDLTDLEQQKECFNYKNLQPLWAEENLRKGAKW